LINWEEILFEVVIKFIDISFEFGAIIDYSCHQNSC